MRPVIWLLHVLLFLLPFFLFQCIPALNDCFPFFTQKTLQCCYISLFSFLPRRSCSMFHDGASSMYLSWRWGMAANPLQAFRSNSSARSLLFRLLSPLSSPDPLRFFSSSFFSQATDVFHASLLSRCCLSAAFTSREFIILRSTEGERKAKKRGSLPFGILTASAIPHHKSCIYFPILVHISFPSQVPLIFFVLLSFSFSSLCP